MQSDKNRQAEHGAGERRAADEMVMLGRVSGVYGVKGWVKIYSYTDPMDAIVDYSPWYIRPGNAVPGQPSSDWQPMRLKHGRRHAKTVVAQFEGCDDRDAAQCFIGYEIAIKPSQLVKLEGEEFYWRDLIGLTVVNQQGITLGIVTALMETGANDVLVVRADDSDRECLIPWAPGEAIVSVSLADARLDVDWQADWCD